MRRGKEGSAVIVIGQYQYEAFNLGDGTWMVNRWSVGTDADSENYVESLFRGYPDATPEQMIQLAIDRNSWA